MENVFEGVHDLKQLCTGGSGGFAPQVLLRGYGSYEEGFVLMDGALHQTLPTSGLVNIWEELSLFVMVVDNYTLNPGQTVTNKVGLVVVESESRCLLVDAVEATDEGVNYVIPRW
jgi:hypothetical protein